MPARQFEAVVSEVEELFVGDGFGRLQSVSRLHGWKGEFECNRGGFWVLVRMSGTEPKLRMLCEARADPGCGSSLELLLDVENRVRGRMSELQFKLL